MAQLRLLLHLKAFRPDQPRIPRDYRHGGRWVGPDDDFGPPAEGGVRESLRYLLASSDPEDFERIPEQLPLRPRERATLARRLARLLVESRPHAHSVVILARMAWLVDNVAHDIEAYFDPPKSLGELREAALNPKKGYDVHHIVEQGPARRDGFDDGQLQSGSNKVLIPRYKHWEISGWFGRKNPKYGGISPRDYLRGQPWHVRERVGLDVLREFGVLER